MAPKFRKIKITPRTLEESVELWTHIRMRSWCKSKINGMVREYNDPRVWDETNDAIVKIGLAEAAQLHGLKVNTETGALVYEGKDVPGTDNATWNKAPEPGGMAPVLRLAMLNQRAQKVGVVIPASNDLDDYEAAIENAEAKSKSRVAVNVSSDMVTSVKG